MDLPEARELRQELEAIEATMLRIRQLWTSTGFPSADDLGQLAKTLGGIRADMVAIQEKVEQMPTTDEFNDLSNVLADIEATMTDIVEKGERVPEPDVIR